MEVESVEHNFFAKMGGKRSRRCSRILRRSDRQKSGNVNRNDNVKRKGFWKGR